MHRSLASPCIAQPGMHARRRQGLKPRTGATRVHEAAASTLCTRMHDTTPSQLAGPPSQANAYSDAAQSRRLVTSRKQRRETDAAAQKSSSARKLRHAESAPSVDTSLS
mmetsp:Transcript_26150/g.82991  ORF Transcript_26150/g.82991 Transcript_26150/m.82991 type:complete len:109 (+) Transcript_26150:82-408(+)